MNMLNLVPFSYTSILSQCPIFLFKNCLSISNGSLCFRSTKRYLSTYHFFTLLKFLLPAPFKCLSYCLQHDLAARKASRSSAFVSQERAAPPPPTSPVPYPGPPYTPALSLRTPPSPVEAPRDKSCSGGRQSPPTMVKTSSSTTGQRT